LIVFSDIDDTLMHTLRKAQAPGSTPGARDKDGNPSSLTSPKQAQLLELMRSRADRFVPVTARSAQAYARLELKFNDGCVLDFGASILDANNQLDQDWHARMVQSSEETRQCEVFEHLLGAAPAGLLKTEHRVAYGVSCFVNLRTPAAAHADLKARVSDTLRELGVAERFYLHCTDRDVCVLPRFIRKDLAVRHLIAREGLADGLIIGMGDSLSDVGFMGLADFMVVPAASRIAASIHLSARKAEDCE
jgi:hydroxymethylpyrimidine pyrophosphatase-like HAD family hydrolase